MITAATTNPATDKGAPIGMREFVALIAALMAMTALGIDSMLPALPAIGDALGVADSNDRQWVIAAFTAGFGVAQIVHGPLCDRYGRRNVLAVSLIIYVLCNVAAALAGTFTLLLVARVAAGAAVAANRVVVVAIVRDCYSGRAMARVMSIAFMVFMIVPVLAPAFGLAVLMFGNWRDIFWAVAVTAAAVLAWFWWRMPETLDVQDRRAISAAKLIAGWKTALGDRLSLGYTLASAALMGALYGYLNSIQQVTGDTFGRPDLLIMIFATTAGTMAAANLGNARLVMRLGTRLISHAALAVLIAVSGLHLLLAATGHETLLVFAILQAITMGCFGLATSNFSAMAMTNMGHIAGTASSVQGFLSVTLGTAIGAIVGQLFDGTAMPLIAGFLFAGVAALVSVAVTEHGRLFRAA